MDWSLPGSSIHGIFQARILEWGAIALSGARCLVVFNSVTSWTVASQPGSSVYGIFQARILEWVAIFFPRGYSWPRDQIPCYSLELCIQMGKSSFLFSFAFSFSSFLGYFSLSFSLLFSEILCLIVQRRKWQPTPVLLPEKSIPWMEEPGRLQSKGSLGVRHDWGTSLSLFSFMHWRKKWQPTLVFLPGESQGRESLVGCHRWGRTESDRTEAT